MSSAFDVAIATMSFTSSKSVQIPFKPDWRGNGVQYGDASEPSFVYTTPVAVLTSCDPAGAFAAKLPDVPDSGAVACDNTGTV